MVWGALMPPAAHTEKTPTHICPVRTNICLRYATLEMHLWVSQQFNLRRSRLTNNNRSVEVLLILRKRVFLPQDLHLIAAILYFSQIGHSFWAVFFVWTSYCCLRRFNQLLRYGSCNSAGLFSLISILCDVRFHSFSFRCKPHSRSFRGKQQSCLLSSFRVTWPPSCVPVVDGRKPHQLLTQLLFTSCRVDAAAENQPHSCWVETETCLPERFFQFQTIDLVITNRWM